LSNPYGLAFDAAGLLYVANAGGNTIDTINSVGVVSIFVPSTAGLNEPAGLGFDGAGTLYASNVGGNSISAITTGGGVSTYATGLSSPNFLAVLPEPSIAGAVAACTLGLLASRRRRV